MSYLSTRPSLSGCGCSKGGSALGDVVDTLKKKLTGSCECHATIGDIQDPSQVPGVDPNHPPSLSAISLPMLAGAALAAYVLFFRKRRR